MRDIIALAKEAFLKTHGGIELNPDKFQIAWIECFSGMLEAEIREEFEVQLENAVSLAFRQDDEIANLTAQNAKLMEALERLVSLKDHKDNNGKDYFYTENVKAAWIQARAALTPQPEKEGKEKDPHQDLLDSWGPSA